MPRRNKQIRRTRRNRNNAATAPDGWARRRPNQYQRIAMDLVARSLASPLILGPTSQPHTTTELHPDERNER